MCITNTFFHTADKNDNDNNTKSIRIGLNRVTQGSNIKTTTKIQNFKI
jgi:hypothetical protein